MKKELEKKFMKEKSQCLVEIIEDIILNEWEKAVNNYLNNVSPKMGIVGLPNVGNLPF